MGTVNQMAEQWRAIAAAATLGAALEEERANHLEAENERLRAEIRELQLRPCAQRCDEHCS